MKNILLNVGLAFLAVGSIVVGILPFCGIPYIVDSKPESVVLKEAKNYHSKIIKDLNLDKKVETEDIKKLYKTNSLKSLANLVIDINEGTN